MSDATSATAFTHFVQFTRKASALTSRIRCTGRREDGLLPEQSRYGSSHHRTSLVALIKGLTPGS